MPPNHRLWGTALHLRGSCFTECHGRVDRAVENGDTANYPSDLLFFFFPPLVPLRTIFARKFEASESFA